MFVRFEPSAKEKIERERECVPFRLSECVCRYNTDGECRVKFVAG